MATTPEAAVNLEESVVALASMARFANTRAVTDFVVTEVAQLTVDWLGSILRRAGALRAGGVLGFDVETREESWSNCARLRLRYTSDSRGDRPASLFLKMCRFAEFGVSEVDYYRRDYAGAGDVPIVRCYNAHYEPQLHALSDV